MVNLLEKKVEPRILLCTDDADVLKGTFEELIFFCD